MQYEPHDYQRYATEYILSHPIAAVLLQMGLGKTIITLTAIVDLLFDFFVIRKVLIIAPLRVAQMTWSDEIKKWDHLGILKYSIVVGTQAQRQKAMAADADIYITNRESVPWLCENYPEFFNEGLMIIVDELSSFKNHQAKRFKALMKMRPKVNRIAGLTGTPSSNGLMDLFAEIKLLDMGERLGWFIGRYREAYFKPDKMNGPIVYSYKPQAGAEEAIYKKISDIAISMKAIDHLDMPELINTEYEVNLSEDEAKKYDVLKTQLVLDMPGGEVTASNAASLSNKLCQMASGAIYNDDGDYYRIHDRKLDALEDIVESMNGAPLLCVYWYKHDLERIKERLADKGIPCEELSSEEAIRRWNAGQVMVGLIQPQSASMGLNLQSGGSNMVWFSLTWSLELYQQTVARLWRQGQTSGTVVVTHIISKGTIDQRVMKALSQKDSIQTALLDAVKAEVRIGPSITNNAED